MASREHLARALWTVFEPIHAVSYFSPQARDAFAAIGLPRFWDGYFAGRSAPLGAVGAAPVTAIYCNFAPAFVERALPAVWAAASVDAVLEARLVGAATTLRAFFEEEDAVAAAADALQQAADAADTIGRPLAAGNQAQPHHDDPYRRIWQATGTLREHRGDGHVIALVNEGIAGLSAIVLRGGLDLDATMLLKARGWTEQQWETERDALRSRGLLDADGRATDAGRAAVDRVELQTNRLALSPWEQFDEAELLRIAGLALPIARSVSSLYPYPNPIGMPSSWDADADPSASTVPETVS
ncbi:MAG: hypothetical protein JWN80_2364 [Microbacteriaceae bacterium]|nr:hypothetical protein [Microbacteriaceae bacterium]